MQSSTRQATKEEYALNMKVSFLCVAYLVRLVIKDRLSSLQVFILHNRGGFSASFKQFSLLTMNNTI